MRGDRLWCVMDDGMMASDVEALHRATGVPFDLTVYVVAEDENRAIRIVEALLSEQGGRLHDPLVVEVI